MHYRVGSCLRTDGFYLSLRGYATGIRIAARNSAPILAYVFLDVATVHVGRMCSLLVRSEGRAAVYRRADAHTWRGRRNLPVADNAPTGGLGRSFTVAIPEHCGDFGDFLDTVH
jgi:hypothetical protein